MKALLKRSGGGEEETIMNTNLEVRETKKEEKEEETEDKKKRKKEKKKGEAYEGKPSETTEKFSWWRNAGFLWGGLVGSKRELDRDVEDIEDAKEKNGFTEDKQEDIFNRAHQMAIAKGSRRGLGDKAKLGKEFTGTKKSFDDEEDGKKKKKKEKKEKEKKRKTRDEDEEKKKKSKKK
jgi:hypothetical protein